MNGDSVNGEGVDSEGGVGEQGRLRNIRGFLFKRRKSPLKGWHKVSCLYMCSCTCINSSYTESRSR